jgi:hypothetical protein
MTPPTTDAAFLTELRAAVAVLERIVGDRTLLAALPSEDRTRLLQAAGHVYAPDAVSRRQLVRATARRRKAEKVGREEALRNQTGIRTLRRRPVVTTPNVFPPVPPEAFEPADLQEAEAPREPRVRQHCYVCTTHFSALHDF